MKKGKLFIINTITLTLSTVIIQLIAVYFSAYLGRIIGSDGIGLYQLVLSVYAFAVTFATSGIRLSTTRLIVEAKTHHKKIKTVINKCLIYSLFFGVVGFVVLYLYADKISVFFLHDIKTALSLKVLSISLPFLAVTSVYSGYFTAVRKINRFAFTQIGQQIVRIIITTVIITIFVPKDLEYICCAISLGAVISEILYFFALFILYKQDINNDKGINSIDSIFKKLLKIAIPDAISAYARSALLTMEHLLIPSGLLKYGMDKKSALSSYGLVHGMTFPIIFFPNALCVSLANLIIPEIAEYYEKKDNQKIDNVVTKLISSTFIFSIFIAGVLYSYSDILSSAIYKDSSAGYFIKILAPLIPIMYTDTAVDGVLKGMGQQISSMRYNIIDASVSVIAVYLLIPKIAIMGYIATIFIAEILNFVLSLNKLVSISKFHFNVIRNILLPVFSIFVSIEVSKVFINTFDFINANDVLSSIFGIGISLITYIFIFKLILSKEEFRKLKSIC